jgi:hypothetical protein
MSESLEYVNLVRILGEIAEINEVFRGDKGTVNEIILVVGMHERFDRMAQVKCFGNLLEDQRIKPGAWVKISGECTAKIGKNGKWWGEVTVRKIEVVKEAPEKSAKSDDDLEW